MKQLTSALRTLVVFVIIFFLSSCSKNDLSKPQLSQQAVDVQELEQSVAASPEDIIGRYRITRFTEDGRNETSRFTGYRFSFEADSSLIARTNSGQIVTGSWVLDTTGTILTIDISGTGSLDKLVGDWEIRESSSSRLVLVNEDRDRVVFTRLGN
jgi:hypothetical protein